MKLIQIGIIANLIIAIFNLTMGSMNFLANNNFNSMVYMLLLAIINLLFATILSILYRK